MATLDERKQLISDLWVDQPDAHAELDRRQAAGIVSATEATQLRHFIDNGYLTTSLDLDDDFFTELAADLARIWQERPPDLAVAAKAGDLVSFRDIDDASRTIGYRIADLHSHSPAALALYLHPQLFRIVELILDQPAVAFQSLYFQFGSEQGLHRDPMFVVTEPPSHLVATWVALEDITPDCGPLLYVPKSHRLPWFEFGPDSINFAVKTDEQRKVWIQSRDRMIEEMGLSVESFTCKRGDVFVWHSGLLHGGMRVEDPRTTRSSLATHYSSAANYSIRRGQMQVEVDGSWRRVNGKTEHILTANGCSGFDGPLRDVVLPESAPAPSPAPAPAPAAAPAPVAADPPPSPATTESPAPAPQSAIGRALARLKRRDA